MEIVVQEAILNKQCNKLWLSDINITSVGISILANAFSHTNSLEVLEISGCNVSDGGVEALIKQLSNNANKLQRLGLAGNNITAKGAKYIAQLLETNTVLTRLDLGYNHIGSEGVQMLSDVIARGKTNISYLDLTSNMLGDSSVEYIFEMIEKNPLLKRLVLYDNYFPRVGKNRIYKAIQLYRTVHIGVTYRDRDRESRWQTLLTVT
jgi:Ran GTPase-activating protein (RanGAP) involved in mRNA processing and transport